MTCFVMQHLLMRTKLISSSDTDRRHHQAPPKGSDLSLSCGSQGDGNRNPTKAGNTGLIALEASESISTQLCVAVGVASGCELADL